MIFQRTPSLALGPVGLLALLLAGCASIDTRALEEAIFKNKPLDEATVVSGLKEALKTGTARGVEMTSVVDGFLGNALIRIALPEQFDEAARLLRAAGFGRQVDDLEVAMNRAAERAAGEAKNVFWSAITQMSIADAFAILRGADDAATRYFRIQTEAELRRRFGPIVTAQMKQVGVYRIYQDAMSIYARLPFVEKPAIDLEAHVTGKALDGLFVVLAQEEGRIREDPAARTTELLRRVFGRQGH